MFGKHTDEQGNWAYWVGFNPVQYPRRYPCLIVGNRTIGIRPVAWIVWGRSWQVTIMGFSLGRNSGGLWWNNPCDKGSYLTERYPG